MKTANYIYSILHCNLMVVWSWGFCNPRALAGDKGLIFNVTGYKHCGSVKVVYDEGKDLFKVILLDKNYKEVKRIDDVYFDLLLDVIDEAVERTDDYDIAIKRISKN